MGQWGGGGGGAPPPRAPPPPPLPHFNPLAQCVAARQSERLFQLTEEVTA
jgi:hypothetical protein